MGTRADHEITPMLSVRYDYHGGPAERMGPVSLTMERHPVCEDMDNTCSVMLRSELTREQTEELVRCLMHALQLWGDRERGDDGRA